MGKVTDPVIIREKEIIKEKGKIEAIIYLNEEAKKCQQFSDKYYKYFFRSIEHSLTLPELHSQVENSLLGFLEYYESNKEYPNEYQTLCDYLFRLYVIQKNGDKAKQIASRLNNMLLDMPANYLYIYKEMLEKSQIATQLMNISQNKKDIEYIYYMIMIQLIDLSWHLDSDWLSNINNYNVNKNGISKLPYKRFEIFNEMKWELNIKDYEEDKENYIFEFFNESDVEVIKRTLSFKSDIDLIFAFYNVYFIDLPFKLYILPHYLDRKFKNLVDFGEWFEYKEINKDNFSSLCVSHSNDLANDFIKSHLK
jgi:hypothetical protein